MQLEDVYLINKDLYGRFWRNHKILPKEDRAIPHLGNDRYDRYSIIRAAMDHEGVDYVLRIMVEENWSSRMHLLVLAAWEAKVKNQYVRR